MKLIVGLGNFPKEYHFTRHNIGFLVVDKIQDGGFDGCVCDFGNWEENRKLKGFISKGFFCDNECILLKPTTYMNLSGESVNAVVKYYKIKESDIIVIQDEIEFAFGKIKVSFSRSSAGHNGIRSINTYIKDTYPRVHFGVGKPMERQEVSSYVLSNFSKEERCELDEKIEETILTLKTLFF